jgi:hypothetical protein
VPRKAKKIFEKIMKDMRLGLMGEGGVSIRVVEDFYLNFPEPTRGAQVEVVGVFVPKDKVFYFGPLAPVGSTRGVGFTDVQLSKKA